MAAVIRAEERRWVGWVAAGFALLTTLPYLIGFFSAGPDWRYTGLLIAAEDGNSYLAKMALGAAGDWLFRTPYTAVSQQGFLAFFPYMLLGKLAAPPGQFEQLVFWFHMFRVSGVAALVYATYRFCSLFLEEVNARRLATLLALLGGGFGFLAPFGMEGLWQGIMKMPLEFYSPETFGFLSALAFPHLAWARALLLLGMVFFLNSAGKPFWPAIVPTGITWLVLGLMQPLTVVTAWAVVGVYLVLWAAWLLLKQAGWSGWKMAFLRACGAGLISSPLVFYNLLSFQFDSFLKRWQAQNLIPSPPPGDYLLAFGVLIPLLVLGAIRWKELGARPLALPLAWLVAFPFLAYAPYNLQRRLPEGIWVALVVIGVAALNILPIRWRKIAVAWCGLAFLSTLFLFVGGLSAVGTPQYPLFRPAGEVKAMNFLAATVQKGERVLAAYDSSTILPTRAPVTVIIGHGPESLGLAENQPRVEAFFRADTQDSDRRALIQQFQIHYIYRGPLEKQLGNWDPSTSPAYRLIYNQGGYQIYAVGPTE